MKEFKKFEVTSSNVIFSKQPRSEFYEENFKPDCKPNEPFTAYEDYMRIHPIPVTAKYYRVLTDRSDWPVIHFFDENRKRMLCSHY